MTDLVVGKSYLSDTSRVEATPYEKREVEIVEGVLFSVFRHIAGVGRKNMEKKGRGYLGSITIISDINKSAVVQIDIKARPSNELGFYVHIEGKSEGYKRKGYSSQTAEKNETSQIETEKGLHLHDNENQARPAKSQGEEEVTGGSKENVIRKQELKTNCKHQDNEPQDVPL